VVQRMDGSFKESASGGRKSPVKTTGDFRPPLAGEIIVPRYALSAKRTNGWSLHRFRAKMLMAHR
jgi:hypothetical protein